MIASPAAEANANRGTRFESSSPPTGRRGDDDMKIQPHDAHCAPFRRDLLVGRRDVLDGLLDAIRGCRNETYALWDHSIRVASTAWRLSLALGLSADVRRLAYLGGLLHDVGKTVTCAHALFKAGPLTEDERKVMRMHPVLGAHLVRDLRLSAVTDAVHLHHELFDGSGYPYGLRGAEIPVVARVVAVADYYEALRESRPYRPEACSRSVALRLIAVLESERKLDPVICRALPAVVRRPAAPSKHFQRAARYFDLVL
jgi:putative nucleotidyltransferase with HDIG domain